MTSTCHNLEAIKNQKVNHSQHNACFSMHACSVCPSTKVFCLNHPLSIAWRLRWNGGLADFWSLGVWREGSKSWKEKLGVSWSSFLVPCIMIKFLGSMYHDQVSWSQRSRLQCEHTDRKSVFKWGRDIKMTRRIPETHHSRQIPWKLQLDRQLCWHVDTWINTCWWLHLWKAALWTPMLRFTEKVVLMLWFTREKWRATKHPKQKLS